MPLDSVLDGPLDTPERHRLFAQSTLDGAERFEFFPIDLYRGAATFRQCCALPMPKIFNTIDQLMKQRVAGQKT